MFSSCCYPVWDHTVPNSLSLLLLLAGLGGRCETQDIWLLHLTSPSTWISLAQEHVECPTFCNLIMHDFLVYCVSCAMSIRYKAWFHTQPQRPAVAACVWFCIFFIYLDFLCHMYGCFACMYVCTPQVCLVSVLRSQFPCYWTQEQW